MSIQVSVIIINYNSSLYTINCVNSIINNTSKNLSYEIIVVDNNSSLEQKELLNKLTNYSNIKVVYSKLNLGFAAGNMYGVQYASGDYYLFLNNDSILIKDCLSLFYNYSINNPNTALLSSYTQNENDELQYNYSHFPTISSKFFGVSVSKLFNKVNYPTKKNIYNKPFKVDLVGGALMFVNAKLFASVGGLDTTFFLYCEEEDLALRFTKAGYDVVIIPEVTVKHFGSKSTEKSIEIKKEFYISFIYFYKKHYGYVKTLLLKLFLVLKLLKKVFYKDNFTLILFILFKADLKNSLRHKQKMG